MKENNDAAFAVRREQDKTKEVLNQKKTLEGNVQELNTKVQRMEDTNQAVSFIPCRKPLIDANLSKRKVGKPLARNQLPGKRNHQAKS